MPSYDITPPPAPAPAYVVVGHIARDVAPAAPGGYTPGGTALYAVLTARRLGVDTGVVTSIDPTFDLDVLEGARVHVVPSPSATVFENRYEGGNRVQFLHGHAAVLGPANIPPAWRSAGILHLGPVADEVDPAIAALFPDALRAATPQGWLRQWDEPFGDGGSLVRPLRFDHIAPHLSGLDVVVLSEQDMDGTGASPDEAVSAYLRLARIVVLTHGAQGATVYAGQGVLHVPAYPAHEVDPTGAGDVFTAAFLIRYRAEKDLVGASRYAAAAASLVVEGPGASAIPTAAQVTARLARGA